MTRLAWRRPAIVVEAGGAGKCALNEECIEAFDVLTGTGVDALVTDRRSPRCFAPPHRPTPSGMTIAL
jgi:hypothetical protein